MCSTLKNSRRDDQRFVYEHLKAFSLFMYLLFCAGKEVPNGKGHKKKDKLWPSDKELRKAICEVLKEVDFNTVSNELL